MNILQHFRPDEAETIRSLSSYCDKAEMNYSPVLTWFLDPREQYILSIVVKQYDLNVHFFGGDKQSERKRGLICPDYFVPSTDDFEVTLIEVDYPDKFVTLKHRNMLGTIMSTGINREQLGDIRVNGRIQFVITRQMVSFIQLELTKIKGASIKLIEQPFEQLITADESWQSSQTTLASLRLDVVVSQLTKKSRNIAQKLIDGEHVKVNHTVTTKVNFTIEDQDLISIKGYGRARVAAIGDRTKKDKIRVTFETLF